MTFFGPNEDSVIDYIVTNRERREEVERLEMVDRTKSDHMPLDLTLKVKLEGDR